MFGFSASFLSLIVLGGLMFLIRFLLAIHRSGSSTVGSYRESHATVNALCHCVWIFPATAAAGMGALWRRAGIVYLDILVVESMAWGGEF